MITPHDPSAVGAPSPLVAFVTMAIVNAGWRFRKLGKGSKEPPSGVPAEDSGDLETVLGWIAEGFQVGLLLGENELVHVDIEQPAVELLGDADFGPALRWRSQGGGQAVIASRPWLERLLGPDVLKGERYVSRTADGELVSRKPKKNGHETLLLEVRSARGKYVLIPGCRGPQGEYVLLNGEPASAARLPEPVLADAALDLLMLSARGDGPDKRPLPSLTTIPALQAHILEAGEHGRHNALFEATACAANLVARGELDEQATLEALHEAGNRRAQVSVERGELLFRGEEVSRTIRSVWRLSTALGARRNGHAAASPAIPIEDEATTLDDARAILEEAKGANDPTILFKHADDLADLSRADEGIFLREAKEAFGRALSKAELLRAIQERRKAKEKESRRADAQQSRERRREKSRSAEAHLHGLARSTNRRKIPLDDDEGLARDPLGRPLRCRRRVGREQPT